MTILLFTFYLLLFTALFIWGQKLLSKLQKLPPGPIRWPILGSIPQLMMIDIAYPYRQFLGLSKKYGPIVSFGYGVHFAVLVTSIDMIKHLFKLPETNSHRFRPTSIGLRSVKEYEGLIWSVGEQWKEVRRFTLKNLRDFGFARTRLMEATYREEVRTLIEDIKEEISTTGGVWQVQSQRLTIVAINSIWSSVCGYTFDRHSDKIKRHINLNMRLSQIFRASSLLSAFPFMKHFPELSGYKEEGELHKNCREFMKGFLEDLKIRRAGRVEAESFVEVFLDEVEKQKENPASEITEAQLITILMDLFQGGTDTTSILLTWLILFMALNQQFQEKLRGEICQATDNWTKQISTAEGSKLPYLRACIYEAMRASPFALVSTPRLVSKDISYAGYKLPRGTTLFYNLYPLFHDKAIWGNDADEYNPDRFFESNAISLDPSKLELANLFGFGPRVCPAETFAMDIVVAVAIGFLSNFKIGLVSGREAVFDVSEPSLTVAPKPYCVKLEQIIH